MRMWREEGTHSDHCCLTNPSQNFVVETRTPSILLMNLQSRQCLVRIALFCFTRHQLGSSETWSCSHLQVHFHIVLMVDAAYPLRSHLELWWEHLPVVLPRDCLASLQKWRLHSKGQSPKRKKARWRKQSQKSCSECHSAMLFWLWLSQSSAQVQERECNPTSWWWTFS